MAPDAEDCETARLNDEEYDVHQGRRILPQQELPAQAWTENEEKGSPGENKRLLPSLQVEKDKSRLQAGLTLGVHSKYPSKPRKESKKAPLKTKYQKRKEKLIAVLKPPYFILCMIIIMICIHRFGSKSLRSQLEWSPDAWWRAPWRLLTYGFVHASATHLALNALVAVAVGWRLEREQGWWRVVIIWCGGVAAGALGAGALQPRVRVVGASAAVYALLTAHLPNVCLRFGHIPLWWFRPLSVLVLGTSEGCWALIKSPAEAGSTVAAAHHQDPANHVAWAAHLLGAAIGVPLAFIVFTGENDGKRYIFAARIISGLVLLAGLALSIVHYTMWYEGDET